jgi:hypothetical protein
MFISFESLCRKRWQNATIGKLLRSDALGRSTIQHAHSSPIHFVMGPDVDQDDVTILDHQLKGDAIAHVN